MIKVMYLVIGADRMVRVLGRRPRLRVDEMAYPLRIDFPDNWGKVHDHKAIDITLPEFNPEVTVDPMVSEEFDVEEVERLRPEVEAGDTREQPTGHP